RIATGFNRNNPMGVDEFVSDPIDDESRLNYSVDRVNTVGTTWLGLTVGCARCHDHKFDPIKQKDFYRLIAFYNNIQEYNGADAHGNLDPVLPLPSLAQKKRLDWLDGQISSTLAQLPEETLKRAEDRWRKGAFVKIPGPPADGLTAHYEFEGNLNDSSGHNPPARVVSEQPEYQHGTVVKSVVFSGQTELDFGNVGDFEWR